MDIFRNKWLFLKNDSPKVKIVHFIKKQRLFNMKIRKIFWVGNARLNIFRYKHTKHTNLTIKIIKIYNIVLKSCLTFVKIIIS